MTKFLRALMQRIVFAAEDFPRGRAFWIPVLAGIVPTIVGALAVSSHGSRLVVTMDADGPQYVMNSPPNTGKVQYRDALAEVIKNHLIFRASAAFVPPPKAPSGNTDAVPEEMDSPSDPFHVQFPTVNFVVKLQVTNIGQRPSTLSSVTYYLVEESDSRRETLSLNFQAPKDVALPEGKPIIVGKPEGESVGIWAGGVFRLVDYETVRILQENLGKAWPKSNRLDLATPYLQLLAFVDHERKQRLLKIADPTHRSRLILGVEVVDIYGRDAHAETVVMDSAKWNKTE